MTTATIDTTTITERPTAYGNFNCYSVAQIVIPNVATPVASGAGAVVTVTVLFNGEQPTDTNYEVQVTASQACAVSVPTKLTTGFEFQLTPLTSGVTLSAGTADVCVKWKVGASGSI